MLMDSVCELPGWQNFLVVLLVHFALGLVNLFMSKTEKVKANSIAELIFNVLVSIVKRKK